MADTTAETNTLALFEQELDIALLEGEEVLYAGRPRQGPLRAYLGLAWAAICAMSIIGLPLLPFMWWATGAYAKKHRYWLTSRRVVVTTGIIGYRARSVPLERVSDVAISCNWLERLLGIRSVVVRDMTGEAQSGAGMLAVDDATEIQRLILEQVHAANRTVPGEDARPMLAAPYRETQQSEMLDLLRRIEENTREG